ncbi:hypoxanthine-guanine phosphoribosyltransferase [Francisellaceae bacterium]|nr:hypoxanthine-guanine phosphoribosyltransferase [Francisellaceae bacterium]
MAEITPNFIKEVHAESDILISESELNLAFDNVAKQLNIDLADKNPIFVCCMNGGLMFTSEIVKRLTMPLQIDYVHASRYRNDYEGGKLNWIKEHNIDFKDRTVVLLDDILDGGITLAEIKKFYEAGGAGEVLTTVMLDKITDREHAGLKSADYVGLPVEDLYVYGFGLDYHGYLRNVPAIYAVAKHHMI